MLRKIRLTVAIVLFTLITALFLDFTGTLHVWFGWLAKIQFLPAVLVLNASIILFLVILTGIFGRIYCSTICPLGVFQDTVSWVSGKRKKKKFRFSHSQEKTWIRYGILILFIAAIIAGLGALVALLAPYSTYGRIVQNLFTPLYTLGNNLLAYIAEQIDSYAFYEKEVWIRSLPTFGIAMLAFVIITILAWRNGRTYCNVICPVGTILSFISRFSWLKIHIDTDKCNSCGLCARSCKASCIDSKSHQVDYSRCIVCGNCIGKCHKHAISFGKYKNATSQSKPHKGIDTTRRTFLIGTALTAATAAIAQEKKKVDGGLATIEKKIAPTRSTPITPPGSWSAKNMVQHCTACQLCVSVCPNDVLRPSTELKKFMQPTMSYERGYCRPECNKCSNVCPAEAIKPITLAEKSSTQIGHAVWIRKNCIPLTDNVSCGNCARHCPVGAITMISSDRENPDAPKIPAVNTERCIGCGACENLCPARPFSAIYVEGHEMHRTV